MRLAAEWNKSGRVTFVSMGRCKSIIVLGRTTDQCSLCFLQMRIVLVIALSPFLFKKCGGERKMLVSTMAQKTREVGGKWSRITR